VVVTTGSHRGVPLQDLKDHGVEVLWRPLHEMNQAAFWWAGQSRPGWNQKALPDYPRLLCQDKGLEQFDLGMGYAGFREF
jgi:hypothetical protein